MIQFKEKRKKKKKKTVNKTQNVCNRGKCRIQIEQNINK